MVNEIIIKILKKLKDTINIVIEEAKKEEPKVKIADKEIDRDSFILGCETCNNIVEVYKRIVEEE